MSLLEQFGVSLQNKGRKKSVAPAPSFNGQPLNPLDQIPLSGYGLPGEIPPPDMPPVLSRPLVSPAVRPVAPILAGLNPDGQPPMPLKMHGVNPTEVPPEPWQFAPDPALTGNYRQQPTSPNLLSMPVRDVKGDGAAQAKAAGIAGLLGTILGGPTGGLAAAQGVVSGMAPAQDYRYQAEANRVGLANQEALQRNALERQAVGDYNQLESARVGDARYANDFGLKLDAQQSREDNMRLMNENRGLTNRNTLQRQLGAQKEQVRLAASRMVNPETGEFDAEGAAAYINRFDASLPPGFEDMAFGPDFKPTQDATSWTNVQKVYTAQQRAEAENERKGYLNELTKEYTRLAAGPRKDLLAAQIELTKSKEKWLPFYYENLAGRLRNDTLRTGIAADREDRLTRAEENGPKVSPANIDHILRQLRDAPQSRAALIKKIDPYADLRGANGVIPFSTDLVRKLYRDNRFKGKGIATEAQFKAEIDRINGEWHRTKKQLDQQLAGEDQRLADLAAKVGKVRDKETGAFVPSPLFDGTTRINTPPKIGAYGNITPNYNGSVGKKALGWKVTSYAEQNDTKDGDSEFGQGKFSPAPDSMEAGRSIAVTPGVKKYIDDLYGKDMKGQIVVVVIEKDGKRYKVNAKLDDVTSRNPALGDRIDIYNPKGVDPGDFPLADGKVITVLKGGIPADIAKGQAAQSLGLRPVSSGVKSTPKAVTTPRVAPTPQPKPVQKPSRKPVSKMTAAEQDAEIARLQKRTGVYTIPGLSDSDTSMLFKPKKK